MTVGVLLGKREHDDRQDEEKAHREPHERKVAIGLNTVDQHRSPLRSDELVRGQSRDYHAECFSILAARSRPRYAARGTLNAETNRAVGRRFHYRRNLPVLQAFCIRA